MAQKQNFILTGVFVLLLGLSQLFILPPYEGIDEFGHYSMIRQFAAQGLVTDAGKMFIDEAFNEYQKDAPTFYSVIEPYEQNGGLTYRDFFKRPELAAPFEKEYRDQAFVQPYRESLTLNWMQQHPPLYYLALAGVQKAASGLSLVGQFFTMRLASFLMGWAGFMIGLWGSLRYSDPKLHKQILLGFALYPVLFLQFTPEFARLGNDSLCLFLVGILWCLFMKTHERAQAWHESLLFGVVLGLGLLTKAFFIPIACGYFAYRFMQMISERKDKKLLSKRWDDLVNVALPVILCGIWYIAKAKATGTFLGHHEYALAYKDGDSLIRNVLSKNTGEDLLTGFMTLIATWTWSGTFSQARYLDLFHLPYLFFALWVFVRGFMALRGQKLGHPVWLAHWMIAFLVAGITHHLVTALAVTRAEATPGWYFHILAPPAAYLLSFGIAEAWKMKAGRVIFAVMIPYTLYFFVAVLWQELTVFSGCAAPAAKKYMVYADGLYCLSKGGEVFDRVAVLAWPYAGTAAFIAALLCLLVLLRRVKTYAQQ